MTTIGLIGAGQIGSQIARLAVVRGYPVVISNSRGPETLATLVAELGPDAGPEQPVIIDDDHPGPRGRGRAAGTGWRGHARLGCRSPAARGIVRETSVPWPGVLRTAADPP